MQCDFSFSCTLPLSLPPLSGLESFGRVTKSYVVLVQMRKTL